MGGGACVWLGIIDLGCHNAAKEMGMRNNGGEDDHGMVTHSRLDAGPTSNTLARHRAGDGRLLDSRTATVTKAYVWQCVEV